LRCTVCAHPQRADIDAALVAGGENRVLAKAWGLGRESVRRHRESHLPAALVASQRAAEVVRGDDLLTKVADLEANARRIATQAEQASDLRTALAGVRELTRIVELLAKLRGQLDESPKVAVLVNSAEWVDLRTKVLRALEPFPAARQAVADALRNGGGQ
jgi:hypothetical protein